MNVALLGDNSLLLDELNNLFNPVFQVSNIIDRKKTNLIIEATTFDREYKFSNLDHINNNAGDNTVILSNSNCIKLLDQARYTRNPSRLLGISLYPTFSQTKGIEFSITNFSNVESIQFAEDAFKHIEREKFWVQDKPGMIHLRLICLIINEAYMVLQEKTATRDDIDTAMKLGTNYPYGPIEWSERIGIETVYAILFAMNEEFGEDRYRITPLLREKFLEELMTR